MAKKTSPSLAAYQVSGAEPAQARKAAVPARFDLAGIDPAGKPFSLGNKTADKDATTALAADLDRLQNLFYGDKRFKLLVVLQGTDTSGKDGAIRGVFGQMSALGVHTTAWKAPSEEEKAHDFLWRIHQKVPAAGEVALFNRSHYEDVLVPVVKKWIDAEETQRRYAQINDFERMLVETGTTVLKFMLHISNEEQRVRLQERLDDPEKHWKFQAGDLEERKLWPQYQDAYSAAIAATGTRWAPWTVVPADSKIHRNVMIASVVRQALEGMKLRFPTGDPALANIKVV